jgi:hypothetical protein
LIAISIIALGGWPGRADHIGPATFAREIDKAPVIRALMSDAVPAQVSPFFDPSTDENAGRPDWVDWCEQFDADFRLQRGIEFVEPVAKAERYDDPALQPWQRRCPLLAMNARTEIGPFTTEIHDQRGLWISRLPQHMPDGSPMGDLQYGTRDFKVYEGDFDNDPGDYGSRETIFFADSYYSYWDLLERDDRFPLTYPPLDRSWNDLMPPHEVPEALERNAWAEYRYLSFRSYDSQLLDCETRTLFTPASPYFWGRENHEMWPRHLINGLIRYRGQYYLFDLNWGIIAYPESGDYTLELQALLPRMPADPHTARPIAGPQTCKIRTW